ncbi:polysaccharide deacetylase family protein [Mangrovicoccus ximenensis]|uniref:hypothetical protein n=1 Tax=Mangrovicoccus ximenensis TaxID=1911570 RepID=UPI000D3ADECA|nr:hypothetical protein [Mangrovicoccus ximenensis]
MRLRRAIASIAETTGARPLGWSSRYGASLHTRELLAEEGGFAYDADSYNDDLPVWTEAGGRPHLVVPGTLANSDLKFETGMTGSPRDFELHLKAAFDRLYKEGAARPRMMPVALHLRLSGHPGRTRALANFIRYAKSFPDVWFARRIDIANHWTARHPAAARAETE